MGWLFCFFVERSCCIVTLLSDTVIPHYQCIEGDHPILRAYWEEAFQETEKCRARSLMSRRHTKKQLGRGFSARQRDAGGRDCGPGEPGRQNLPWTFKQLLEAAQEMPPQGKGVDSPAPSTGRRKWLGCWDTFRQNFTFVFSFKKSEANKAKGTGFATVG